MSLSIFLQYVEIKTKLASLYPFIFGVLYSLYLYGKINVFNTVYMYISLLCLDMATTAINNYMDFKKAKVDDYKFSENIIGRNKISEKLALTVILTLLSISIVFGLILVYNTTLLVLLLGAFSFCVGVLYTFGPIPISRMPLGEIVSGTVMGFLIIFIVIYIQDIHIALISLHNNIITVNVDLNILMEIFLVSLPFVFIIANLMLGNNMRDLEIDIKNERFLLPYYIGIENSLKLYKLLYVLVFISIITSVILKVLPISMLLILLISKKVLNNVENYKKELVGENKPMCFKYSVLNMKLIGETYIFLLVVSLVIKYFI